MCSHPSSMWVLGPTMGDVLESCRADPPEAPERPALAAWMGRMAKLPFHDQAFASPLALGPLDGPEPLLSRIAPATKAGLEAVVAAQKEM